METCFSQVRASNSNRRRLCSFLSIVFALTMISLSDYSALARTVPAGDVAPLGAPNGVLGLGDLVVVQRMIMGQLPYDDVQREICDVAPLGMPDGELNAADLLVLQRAVLGLLSLPDKDIQDTVPLYAFIKGANSGGVNESIWFDGGESKGDPNYNLEYSWDFGDGAQGTGAYPSHVYNTPGMYTVTLTVSQGLNQSQPVSKSVNIKQKLSLSGTITGVRDLQGDTIYTVDSNLEVGPGGTLNIPAGTELWFNYYANGNFLSLSVYGDLNVNGTESNPVIFKSYRSFGYQSEWRGIHLLDGSSAHIEHAEVSNSWDGVKIANRYGGSVVVKNSFIHTNFLGMHISDFPFSGVPVAKVADKTIEWNGEAIFLWGGVSPVITGNIIRANTIGMSVHPYKTKNPKPIVTGNDIYDNTINYFTDFGSSPASYILNARSNWWGTSNEFLLASGIHDVRKQSANPTVDYSGYRNGPHRQGLTIDTIPEVVLTNAWNLSGFATPGSQVEIVVSTWRYSGESYETSIVEQTADSQGRFYSPITIPPDSEISVHARRLVNGVMIEVTPEKIIYSGVEPAVPVMLELPSTTSENPIYISFNAGMQRDVKIYLNGQHYKTFPVHQTTYNVTAEIVLNDGDNVLQASYVDVDGEGPMSEPITIHYVSQGTRSYSFAQITDTVVWSPGTGQPYVVDGLLLLGINARLIIMPGTTVKLSANAQIIANGELDVRGTQESPVLFTNASGDPGVGQWSGIVSTLMWPEIWPDEEGEPLSCNNCSRRNGRLQHAIIENSSVGIWYRGGRLDVHNCLFRNNTWGLLIDALTYEPSAISENTFENNLVGIGVNKRASAFIYPRNIIRNNEYGIWATGSGAFNENPAVIVRENQLYGNVSTDFGAADYFAPENVQLDAVSNWWGTNNTDLIDYNIYDRQDDPVTAPTIAYSLPLQTQPTPSDLVSPYLSADENLKTISTFVVTGRASRSANIRWYLNDVEQGTLVADAQGGFSLPLELPEGRHTVRAVAYTASSTSPLSNELVLIHDETPPVITIDRPVDGATERAVSIIGTVSEPATVIYLTNSTPVFDQDWPPVIIQPGEPGWGSHIGSLVVDADNRFRGNPDPSFLSPGSNYYTIVATDPAGNVAVARVDFNLDIVPPQDITVEQVVLAPPTNGSVSISAPAGSVEASAQLLIINARTGESVSVNANADGSLSSSIAAAAGDEIVFQAADVSGNRAPVRVKKVTGAYPAPSLSIQSPLPAAVIGKDTIGIHGTYQGPANSGIQINGQVVPRVGDAYCIDDIPLVAGTNTLSLTITAVDGQSATQTVDVTRSGPADFVLHADKYQTYAPDTVSFTLADTTQASFVAVEYDLDGDGGTDVTHTDTGQTVTHSYAQPGCYRVSVRATTDEDVVYQDARYIAVQDKARHENSLIAIWYTMLEQLRAGNVNDALFNITPESQSHYQGLFDALQGNMAQAADMLGVVEGINAGEGWAQLNLVRMMNGVPNGFAVTLTRADSGVWRIESM